MAMEASEYSIYEANNLNQYSSISKNEDPAFVPTFDAAGNQTLVRTATGTWSVTYNAENRPVIFQKNTDSVTTRITCTYDYMGRRATKKVEEITTDAEGNETTTVISNHRFIYRGYLQIACCDLSRSEHPCLWLITWDPTQPVATSPLAIQKDGTWFCYGWDLTKNICEVFGKNGYIRSTYAYIPFGSVSTSGDVEQPIQWSSEYYDNELALVYYNYRHYNLTDGRWINRDPIAEQGGWNLYGFVGNNNVYRTDKFGLNTYRPWMPGLVNPISTYDDYGVSEKPYSLDLVYVSSPDDFDSPIIWTQILWSVSGIRAKNKTEFTPNQELKKDSKAKCISSIMIIAHGFSDESGHVAVLFLGNDSLYESKNDKFDFNTQISHMFRGIKFCNQCKVELRACLLGKSKYLKKRLEKITGCEIVLYSEKVGPYVNK